MTDLSKHISCAYVFLCVDESSQNEKLLQQYQKAPPFGTAEVAFHSVSELHVLQHVWRIG